MASKSRMYVPGERWRPGGRRPPDTDIQPPDWASAKSHADFHQPLPVFRQGSRANQSLGRSEDPPPAMRPWYCNCLAQCWKPEQRTTLCQLQRRFMHSSVRHACRTPSCRIEQLFGQDEAAVMHVPGRDWGKVVISVADENPIQAIRAFSRCT